MLFNLIQQVMQTFSQKDMARSPREKQREREDFEDFEDFSADYRGQIESPVFANPFVSSTFTAQKKPVE